MFEGSFTPRFTIQRLVYTYMYYIYSISGTETSSSHVEVIRIRLLSCKRIDCKKTADKWSPQWTLVWISAGQTCLIGLKALDIFLYPSASCLLLCLRLCQLLCKLFGLPLCLLLCLLMCPLLRLLLCQLLRLLLCLPRQTDQRLNERDFWEWVSPSITRHTCCWPTKGWVSDLSESCESLICKKKAT